jgi:hypothetical protein
MMTLYFAFDIMHSHDYALTIRISDRLLNIALLVRLGIRPIVTT